MWMVVAVPVLLSAGPDPRRFVEQATALEAKGQLDEAEAALRRGLAAHPHHAELLYDLGLNLVLRDRWAEAIEAFTLCAQAAPGNFAGWWGLGRSYEAVGQADRAVA